MAAMSQEEFLLKWNDHHASFFTIVEDLCRSELLCDVTLACGGQVFETHRLVLCVCSPYFRALLTARPDKHPIVYLKDVNPKHLEQLLSYMYRGEINVLQDDLGPLIETARGLQIKGLADAGGSGNSDSGKKEKSSSNGDSRPSQPAVKRSRTATPTPVSSGKAARLDGGGKMNHSAAAAAMDNKSFRVGQVTVNPPTPSVHQADMFVGDEEEDEAGIVDSEVKQEMWVATGGEDGDDYEDIPPEQYEQELQAEDEQYIQAGQDTAQQIFQYQSWKSGSNNSRSNLPEELVKKYPCEFCQKRFPTPSKLQRHQLVHSGEKPYICFICMKGFTQKVHLNTHKKFSHPIQSQILALQTPVGDPPAETKGGKEEIVNQE